MPTFHHHWAVVVTNPDEYERPPGVAEQSECEPRHDQEDASPRGEPKEFSEEQAEHERRLHGTNSAARFVDARPTAAGLDDITVLRDGHAEPSEDVDDCGRIHTAQSLDEMVFETGAPGDGGQEKGDREPEMTKPRPASHPVDQEESDPDGE